MVQLVAAAVAAALHTAAALAVAGCLHALAAAELPAKDTAAQLEAADILEAEPAVDTLLVAHRAVAAALHMQVAAPATGILAAVVAIVLAAR